LHHARCSASINYASGSHLRLRKPKSQPRDWTLSFRPITARTFLTT